MQKKNYNLFRFRQYIISLRFIILIPLRSIISHKLCIEGSDIYFYHICSLHLMMLLLFALKFILDWWLEFEVLRYFMSLKFLLLIQMLRLWHRLFLLFFMSSCYECCPWQFRWLYVSRKLSKAECIVRACLSETRFDIESRRRWC